MNVVLVDQRVGLPELLEGESCRQCGIVVVTELHCKDRGNGSLVSATVDGNIYWISPVIGPFCSVPCALRYMEINL